MASHGSNAVSGWAEEIFGEDIEEIESIAEQIIEEDGISLHISMVIPVSSARDWHEHYSNAIAGSAESMLKMWMFLEAFCVQIEEGLDMEVGEEASYDDDTDEWGMGG